MNVVEDVIKYSESSVVKYPTPERGGVLGYYTRRPPQAKSHVKDVLGNRSRFEGM